MTRIFYIFICGVLLLSCKESDKTRNEQRIENKQLTGESILEKSIQFHDINNEWKTANFKVVIEEPRIGNQFRNSIVELDNKSNYFKLQRNRGDSISTHISQNNNYSSLLNGQIITDSLLIKKYRLDPKRNKGYHRFYKTLLGLPMSLDDENKTIKQVEEITFNSIQSYKITIELEESIAGGTVLNTVKSFKNRKESLFSKDWILYVAKNDFRIIGLEMIYLDDPNAGGRIIFEGDFNINNISIPRIRHWRELDNSYNGSDILME
ncbi:DUF6503 family protein [Hanstruepera ponticola]|uniref:DUF6503 family protein n=1 Tax=Hanstruepera ponticola TaxID=2042995 RepID=UPI00177BE862|nr:DUF6503 family protein [Hanstruepera ponticola]